MQIDLYATQPHYLLTLLPIWQALAFEERGVCSLAGVVADVMERPPIKPLRYGHPLPSRLCLAAGYSDQNVVSANGGIPIYVQHGVGQTYNGREECRGADDPSFAGSQLHDKVVLFIAPSPRVASLWAERYPDASAAAVGCPHLDGLHAEPRARPGRPGRPVVAVTFHSDAKYCQETGWAFEHFKHALPGLARAYPGMLGHAHPRAWSRLAPVWDSLGVEASPDPIEILRRADVLVADNTSLQTEAASCGIPLVFLNSPHYDRSIDHGCRFWDWPKGQVSCDEPGDLLGAVAAALEDPPEARAARQAMVADAYAACDGHAAERAAEAIRALCASRWPDEERVREGAEPQP